MCGKYNIQRIDGLEESNPPEEVYERIKNENKLIAKARDKFRFRFFKDKFISSLNAIITGVYEVKEFKWQAAMAILWN